MANLNKVFLIGRLTRDPQQRFLPSGQSLVEFGLAVNRTYTVNGEKREETTFADIDAWGQQGDLIHKYVKRGNPIFVEGRLKLDSWQTKEGEKRSRMRIVLERFQFLGQGGDRPAGAGRSGAPADAEIDPADFGLDSGGGGGAGGGGEEGAAQSDVPF